MVVLAMMAGVARGVAPQELAYRVHTAGAGVYKLAYGDLESAGVSPAVWPSSDLCLTRQGIDVPLWVEDGGDGRFEPGDWFEFVDPGLRGNGAYYHEYSAVDVHRLAPCAGTRQPSRMTDREPLSTAPGVTARLSRRVHLEEDRLLVRLAARDIVGEEYPELWFWSKLTHLDREPLSLTLDLEGLDPESAVPVALRAGFRGLSSQMPGRRFGPLDHSLEIDLDSEHLLEATWDGRRPYSVSVPPIRPARLAAGDGTLEMWLAHRKLPGGKDSIIDVVMLNWVEVDYPHLGRIGERQLRLELERTATALPVRLRTESGEQLTIYGAGGERVELPLSADVREGSLSLGETTTGFWAVPSGHLLRPERVEVDTPSSWYSPSNRADYLIVSHARLLDAVRPLAEFHRARGLTVALVDVQDLYDEFNHGIVDPRAIKDFIDRAYHHWEPPSPRYVLLVGDASWDTKNAFVDDTHYANWSDRQLLSRGGFGDKAREAYTDSTANVRNLVPTHNYHAEQGHSASDNWFVAIDGDDQVPDLAIGRLPVATPEELEGIVDKTIRYADAPPPGRWRRDILWIANEWAKFQDSTDELAAEFERRGFEATKLYPPAEPAVAAEQVEALTRELNTGHLLVNFMGHGGRFIWRTGPVDLKASSELFTLEDIDALRPNERLPVVLSLTCHSGPFDHPDADSIAEKFLRVPDKGAIAVVSSGWRTSIPPVFTRILIEELTQPGRIGDAFLRAKQRAAVPRWMALYNLFGDPAAPLPFGKDDAPRSGGGETTPARRR